ncbi:Conserved oligomeric Golgi complex component 8 [Streptomyces misionensis JCM 4497]
MSGGCARSATPTSRIWTGSSRTGRPRTWRPSPATSSASTPASSASPAGPGPAPETRPARLSRPRRAVRVPPSVPLPRGPVGAVAFCLSGNSPDPYPELLDERRVSGVTHAVSRVVGPPRGGKGSAKRVIASPRL